ncbi:hypothetical protein [Absidia glauca]|uniref:HMA domain-containing protein n=1 Tax=Absidia glauca TaxID=4829 RepID=A0A168PHE6_ABSGL|nr:hypothetical protein [Absidia glauca]
MPQYTFNVAMSCSGCSGAVERALKKVDGVDSIEISLEKQTVVVDTNLPRELILETIKKTGKTVTEMVWVLHGYHRVWVAKKWVLWYLTKCGNVCDGSWFGGLPLIWRAMP